MPLIFMLILLAGTLPTATDLCPVTKPPSPPFVPPAPYSRGLDEDAFLFGTPDLWVRLFKHALPLREKVFWWRPGFDGAKEGRPGMTIAIRQVDSAITTIVDRPATNAYFDGAWAILTMIDFPAEGCWEVKGTYAGHSVSFVTRVQH